MRSGTISVEDFYALQKAGNYATTSQVNPSHYLRSFEPVLRSGKKILYLCFSSKISWNFQFAQVCAEDLCEKYPGRKIICLDTLCASVGEGFLVCEAAQRQETGHQVPTGSDGAGLEA